MQNGYIKLFRRTLDNPTIMKDAEYLAVWIYLLLNATHKNIDVIFKGERITLQPGQLITGRNLIAKKLKVNSSKVQRILECYENEQQIEQQMSNKNRLISIRNWADYQIGEQQVNNKWTTSEQQVNTNNNVIMKELNNNMNIIINNWDKNLECEAINKTNKLKCCRRSSYEINGKNYCNQHSREIIKDILHYKNNLTNTSLPNWFDKDFEKDERNLDELDNILSDFK